MCLNGAAVKVLASFLWCPHCDVVQIWPGRSLDTSAGLFPSMSAGEEFECEASIVLSISNNWWTIGERIHYTKTSSLINLTERERFHLLCSANYGYEAHSSCWDSSVRIQKLIRKDSNSSVRIHTHTHPQGFTWTQISCGISPKGLTSRVTYSSIKWWNVIFPPENGIWGAKRPLRGQSLKDVKILKWVV